MARTRRDPFATRTTRDTGGPRLYRRIRRWQTRQAHKAERRAAREEIERQAQEADRD